MNHPLTIDAVLLKEWAVRESRRILQVLPNTSIKQWLLWPLKVLPVPKKCWTLRKMVTLKELSGCSILLSHQVSGVSSRIAWGKLCCLSAATFYPPGTKLGSKLWFQFCKLCSPFSLGVEITKQQNSRTMFWLDWLSLAFAFLRWTQASLQVHHRIFAALFISQVSYSLCELHAGYWICNLGKAWSSIWPL